MQTYPKKYDRLLKEGEKVLWYKKGETPVYTALFIPLSVLFGLLALILFVGVILSKNYSWIPPSLFFIILCIALNYYYVSLSNIHYVITNQRIIRDTKPRSKFQIFQTRYEEIHEINMNYPFKEGFISYYKSPRTLSNQNGKGSRYVLFLPKIKNDKEMLHLLQETWMPQSPYQIFVDKFQAIAQKYDLEFEGFHPHRANKITMKGAIDQMPFLLSLSELYDIKTMSISITCPNAEGNYLAIRKEKTMDNVGKLMGLQDLKINNNIFDDRFLLQSDNQHFLEKILNQETQETIFIAAKLLDWKMSLGVKPYKEKIKKTHKKEDEDILDAHLMLENNKITKRDESNTTALIYECDNLTEYSSHLQLVLENCISNTEMMIKLAKRIKAYNG